jgi:hypothetical protein
MVMPIYSIRNGTRSKAVEQRTKAILLGLKANERRICGWRSALTCEGYSAWLHPARDSKLWR